MQLVNNRTLWFPVLQCVRPSVLACALLLSVLLFSLTVSTAVAAAATVVAGQQHGGRPVRPLHGRGYEHLDCSACLTVSRALFDRLNNTLSENPSTYLASHRLNRANQLKRRPYRNSELLVTEVMDNFCRSYQNDERSLRLHPKSKVRLYHQQVWKDAKLAVRPSLREDEVYPEGTHDPQWDDYVELRRYQVAKVYSPKDQEGLHGMAMLSATPTMCATLVEEFEEEIESLVKLAHNLSDVEYGLCGLPLADSVDEAATAEAAEVRAAIRPITNICARTDVLRAAAHQDQLRWSQYMRREERRQAKQAEKTKAIQTSDTEEIKADKEDGSKATENVAEDAHVAGEDLPDAQLTDAVKAEVKAREVWTASEDDTPTLQTEAVKEGLSGDSDEGDL